MTSLRDVRKALWDFYAFGPWEIMDLDTVTDDDFERIEDCFVALFSAFCGALGHDMIDDQCGKPEHRYCVYCRSGPEGLVGEL